MHDTQRRHASLQATLSAMDQVCCSTLDQCQICTSEILGAQMQQALAVIPPHLRRNDAQQPTMLQHTGPVSNCTSETDAAGLGYDPPSPARE